MDERQKQIVTDCENVINTTPQIRYIDTELRYTFTQLKNIQRKIAEFGKLHTKPIGSGKICVFESTKDAKKAPSASPKVLNMDEIIQLQLKSSQFEESKQKVRLTFKVNEKGGDKPEDIDIMKHLVIDVHCTVDGDEDMKENDIEVEREETIKFEDCSS